jgi:hypothetical protein
MSSKRWSIPPTPAGQGHRFRHPHPDRQLGVIELATGAAAVVGGILLAVRPDGSLVSADSNVLQGSPFSDWRLPGVLLATLVGLRLLGTGAWQLAHGRYRHELSLFAGIGLICFEAAELAWLGFQPLEAVLARTPTQARRTSTCGSNVRPVPLRGVPSRGEACASPKGDVWRRVAGSRRGLRCRTPGRRACDGRDRTRSPATSRLAPAHS